MLHHYPGHAEAVAGSGAPASVPSRVITGEVEKLADGRRARCHRRFDQTRHTLILADRPPAPAASTTPWSPRSASTRPGTTPGRPGRMSLPP
jgi:hypothetical protein